MPRATAYSSSTIRMVATASRSYTLRDAAGRTGPPGAAVVAACGSLARDTRTRARPPAAFRARPAPRAGAPATREVLHPPWLTDPRSRPSAAP